MKLIDVFSDALTGSGIFDALDNYNVPWKTDISSISLDLEYFGNISGDKTVSPLVRKLAVDGEISPNAISKIAQSLYSMHGLRWTKLWDTYQLEYDPIQNYSMTEIMSDDDTITTYGRTHSKTGTEVDDRTRTDDNKESVYGFNSSAASDSDESDRTINDDNTHTYNLSDTDTGSDRQSHSYELTRSGNIGVTTSQQMIESERALWMWRYFYDVVFPDIDKMLTISVYSDDVTSIVSGGITPTGEISIALNGTYDVTEYASAAVSVPNTYTDADNGMVVYNGELVSQIGRELNENGTYDTTLNNAVMVNVPNTYTAADEGRVVDNGELVVQGSLSITENGTYDTTLIDELTANISDQRMSVVDIANNASISVLDLAGPREIPNTDSEGLDEYDVSFVFMYADNQTTDMRIGDTVYPSSDMMSWAATSDKIYLIADTIQVDGAFPLSCNAGDAGNHAETFVGFRGMNLIYSQIVFTETDTSITLDSALSKGMVVFLFSLYNGGSTATITFMNESVNVPRYAYRYSNSIYIFSRWVSDLPNGTVIDITVSGTASNIIGVMGVFS